jgi:hypothetical protein
MAIVELEQIKVASQNFDVLASVRMLENDIYEFGSVRQETLNQMYDEELTYVVEALDKPHQTAFFISYDSESNDLFNQRGDSLTESYKKGYAAAQKTAAANPMYKFHEYRCLQDIYELADTKELMRTGDVGESVVVLSPFPEEAYASYGKQNLEAIGYQPQRLLGFIRVNQKIDEHTVKVTSFSIDNSDLSAFRSVAEFIGTEVPVIIPSDMFLKYRSIISSSPESLVEVYDKSMSQKYGGNFSAGRRQIGEENAWEFIIQQKELCEYYFSELKLLATRTELSDLERAELKNSLTVGFWARLSEADNNPIDYGANLTNEVYGALQRAENRYETMVGCGGSMMLAPTSLLENSYNNVFGFLFSNKTEQLVWTNGKCRVKGCPSRSKTTKVGPCSVCVACQHLFDKNKDPKQEYKKLKSKNKWKKPQPNQQFKILI